MQADADAASLTSPAAPRAYGRTGWSLGALMSAFLLMDATLKLLVLPVVLEANEPLGFGGAAMARGLGVLLAVCTILYIIPRTAVLGAILLTGYLGGSVAVHVRVGDPLFSHVLFGVYVGVMLWAALALRDPVLRGLLMHGKGTVSSRP